MTNDDLEQLDRVLGTFRPVRTDDLKPGAATLIGWRGEWRAMWVVERGPYEGEWAMMPGLDGGVQIAAFAWTPFCDLANVELIDGPTAPLAGGECST